MADKEVSDPGDRSVSSQSDLQKSTHTEIMDHLDTDKTPDDAANTEMVVDPPDNQEKISKDADSCAACAAGPAATVGQSAPTAVNVEGSSGPGASSSFKVPMLGPLKRTGVIKSSVNKSGRGPISGQKGLDILEKSENVSKTSTGSSADSDTDTKSDSDTTTSTSTKLTEAGAEVSEEVVLAEKVSTIHQSESESSSESVIKQYTVPGPPPSSDTATSKDNKLSPSHQPKHSQVPVAYLQPKWGGPTGQSYCVEVLKNGKIIDTIKLSDKSFYIFGRLPACDVPMEHPSISRYHAILQHCSTPDERHSLGWYVYDLESTHGTWVNKVRVKSRVYCRLHVGHVFKFGGSTRLFILQVMIIKTFFYSDLLYCKIF